MDPHKITFFTELPGIYSIIFDNNYSWFNSKIIRYRVCILEPELTQ